MTERMEPEEHTEAHVPSSPPGVHDRARESAVAAMVSASLMAVAGTLIFAWALRAPEYPWLFAVGALPWVVGVLTFARALWRYTHA